MKESEFLRNELIKYLKGVSPSRSEADIVNEVASLGALDLRFAKDKYHLHNDVYYLDKYFGKVFNNEVSDTYFESNFDVTKFEKTNHYELREETKTYLEELITYAYILFNNGEEARAKDISIYIFNYAIELLVDGDIEGNSYLYTYVNFFEQLNYTPAERKVVEKYYAKYLCVSDDQHLVFEYLFFFEPIYYKYVIDNLVKFNKPLFDAIMKEVYLEDCFDCFLTTKSFKYALDKYQNIDYMFKILSIVTDFDVFTKTMLLIAFNRPMLTEEELLNYKKSTTKVIKALKSDCHIMMSVIYNLALRAFPNEDSFIIESYKHAHSMDSFLTLNALDDDLFNKHVRKSDMRYLNIDEKTKLPSIDNYLSDTSSLVSALFDTSDVTNETMLLGINKFKERCTFSKEGLYTNLLNSLISYIDKHDSSFYSEISKIAYEMYLNMNQEFDLYVDLINAFPRRTALKKALQLKFRPSEIFVMNK